jgi:hypothetical protein
MGQLKRKKHKKEFKKEVEELRRITPADKFEDKLKSWEKYTDISDSVNTLIAPSVA